jgi:hypothetical protein
MTQVERVRSLAASTHLCGRHTTHDDVYTSQHRRRELRARKRH